MPLYTFILSYGAGNKARLYGMVIIAENFMVEIMPGLR
jgi:hypothetical protein